MSALVPILLWVAATLLIGWRITQYLAANARQSVPRLGSIIEIGSTRLHVHQMGPTDRPPLVLIHGLYGQMQHYLYALAAPLAQEFRVVLIDRPGAGHSTRKHAMCPERQATVIGAALDRLGIRNPILVGHSLGGSVSIEMAFARPESLRGLVLIAPAVTPVLPVPGWLPRGLLALVSPILPLLSATLAAPLVVLLRPLILNHIFRPEPVSAAYATRGGAVLGLQPGVLRAAVEDVLSLGATAQARAAALETASLPPGRVIFGTGDKVVPLEPQIAALQSKGWSATRVPDRGHMILLTDPDPIIALIRDLASATPPDPQANSSLDPPQE